MSKRKKKKRKKRAPKVRNEAALALALQARNRTYEDKKRASKTN